MVYKVDRIPVCIAVSIMPSEFANSTIHWVKQAHFIDTELAQASTQTLVRQITRVRALWSWDSKFNLFILPSNRWATLLLEALQPRFVQLELPFARLHKT